MIDFPKVTKSAARSVSGHKSVKKILGSFVVAVGVASASLISATDSAEAYSSPNAGFANNAQGALLLTPTNQDGNIISYHRSHRSHYSHRSHQSHYSSRW